MADPGLEGLLANLRRQATQSPLQQQQPPPQQQQHTQQHQQQAPPVPPMYMHSPPPPMDSVQHPPFHPFPYPQQYSADSPVYSPMQQPQAGTPGFTSVPENGFPGFYQPPPMQAPETAKQQSYAIPTASQPPFSLPMSPPSGGGPGEARTASLLSLLKFSQAVPPPGGPSEQMPQSQQGVPTPPRPAVNSPLPMPMPQSQVPPHNRSISASDLVATLFGPPSASKENLATSSANTSPVQQRMSSHQLPQRSATAESVPQTKAPVNPQDLVFQLLGRTKPVQEEQNLIQSQEALPTQEPQGEASSQRPSATSSSMPPPPPNYTDGPTRASPIPVEGPSPSQTPSKGLFTYVNPFEQLSATSPRNRTPKSATPGPGAVTRKSTLGLNEMRAEDFPLPGSHPVSPAPSVPPAPVEAEAAREASTLDQVRDREQRLMEQLGHHAEEYVPPPKPTVEEEAPAKQKELQPEPSHEQPEPEQPRENVEPTPEVEQRPAGESPAISEAPRKEAGEEEEDGYESAPESQPIEVYNFPMKPFSSITIVPSAVKRPKYPSSKISDVARMTRTFDQLDRNLIASSQGYIVYALSKSNGRGGIRIIRQYDGKDRVLMKDSTDRTFNVTIGRKERVLGTGVSGAVVWVDLEEDFGTDSWDSMFVFPPSEEQGQSNGVLKSRARKTSRHPDCFAIGRGKTISIIHAPTARAYADGRKNNVVASKKYLADHTRMIDTGKASKDFAFSDDDSVIISIDKAGKLKLWDVQGLLDFSDSDSYDVAQKAFPPRPPMIHTNPTLVFSAVAAGESYRATSVMFLDKFRPYLKCLALRYVIVGMKQNHTLQLWDLALGRPVQEINFPQESETDALCSVAYHPLSGIIVVGNPTRNSICFIHLSAPKYNLPSMSQAQYIRGLANKDPTIPKPEATAILSGLREYSFASKGQLMSLDILDCESDQQEDNQVLFELYVAHSKGMTTLSVFKEDLGWEQDNRVKNPIDAVARGVVTLSSLSLPPPPEREDKSEATNEASLKPTTEKSKSRSVSPAARTAEKSDAGEEKTGINGSGKKKKKDKASATTSAAAAAASVTDEPKAERAKAKAAAPATPSVPSNEPAELNVPAGFLDREVKRIETTVSAEFSKVINRELETLCKIFPMHGALLRIRLISLLDRRFDDDRRIQQAAGDAKQDAILRLLSSTLTENVEQVISRIVVNNIQGQVVPAIADVAASAVNRTLGESLNRTLSVSLPAELRAIVPEAINRTLSQPELLSRISDSLTRPLTQAVEREFSHCLHSSMIPAFQKLAVETAQKAVIETERKHGETLAALEQIHRADSRKIDQLMATVQQMAEAMSLMAKKQDEFQEQVRQAQAEYYEHGASQVLEAEKTAEQLEAEEIEELLRSGKYEDGTIKVLRPLPTPDHSNLLTVKYSGCSLRSVRPSFSTK
jgi:WD40 repeat protein